MKLKVLTNRVGKWYLGDDTQMYRYKLAIVNDNGKVIEHNGHKCILEGMFEEDLDFDYEYELGAIFFECWRYALNTWSSTNYQQQCISFFNVFDENYKEISGKIAELRKDKLRKKIAELEKQLGRPWALDDLTYEAYDSFGAQAIKYNRWHSEQKEKLSSIKKGTEMYEETRKKLDEYKALAEKYEALRDKAE